MVSSTFAERLSLSACAYAMRLDRESILAEPVRHSRSLKLRSGVGVGCWQLWRSAEVAESDSDVAAPA